jgi:peptidoglycan/xylan/chitin deacetylase (PgdA/CDA1 family)
MYHGICRFADDPNGTCTSLERFQGHMRYLKLRNLRGVCVGELRRAAARGNARGLVGLTFDDGYENFLQAALPVLESLGFTATVFVVSGMLGEENDWQHYYEPKPRLRLLAADGVREVAARRMEVGSHSMTHPKLVGLDPGLLNREVGESRRILNELLDQPVEGFCYPYGNLDGAAVQAVRRAGYTYACAVYEEDKPDEYTLPRIPISQRDSLPRFVAKLGIYWQYSATKSRLRGVFGKGSV